MQVIEMPEEGGERCETDGCYREATLLLHLGIAEATLDFDDNEETWRCSVCKAALREGNRIPHEAIKVIRRA